MPIEAAAGMRRTLGSLAGEPDGLAPGVFVSLNLDRRKMLATEGREVVLTYLQPTAQIPLTMGERGLAQLKKLLDRGEIVLGKASVSASPRRGLLEPFYDEIDKAETVDQIRHLVFRIASRQKHLQGLEPAEALRHLIAHESQSQCRPDVMNFIGSVMERTGGHSGVTEDVQDARTVILPRRSDGTIAAGVGPMEATPEHKAAIRDII
jgi:hypothetical protein